MSEVHLVELSMPLSNIISTNSFGDKPTLDELQRRYIRHILDSTGRKVGGSGGTTAILGMKLRTLYSRIRQLGLPNKGNEEFKTTLKQV